MNTKMFTKAPLATVANGPAGRLRAARLKKFPTLTGLAQKIGVHVNSVGGWERTGRLPKGRLVRAAYLAALGLTEQQVAQ